VYRYDADELDAMASGIIIAIRKHGIPVDELADEEVWKQLQKRGYKFPVSGKAAERRQSNYVDEITWWFEALHLAIERVRQGSA
jgi:hypothetical protein